ncbi:MAG: PKD domain-containing protein [Bacteroidia bacterium]|nr:PKD domain-containing protein [Bacteroidia bacterium]
MPLLLLLIFLPGLSTAQLITNITPAYGQAGQTLSVNITGSGVDYWASCATPAEVVRLYGGPGPNINSTFVLVNSGTNLTATFNLPAGQSSLGTYNVKIEDYSQNCTFGVYNGGFTITNAAGGNTSYLEGHVYHDDNGDCQKNGVDYPLGSKILNINPGNITVSTDPNGNFGIWLPLGNYTITDPNSVGYHTCLTNVTANLTTIGDTVPVSISLVPNQVVDMVVSVSTGQFQAGFTVYQAVGFFNQGHAPASGVVKVLTSPSNSLMNLTSLPAWTSVVNDTLIYNFTNLGYGVAQNILLFSECPVIFWGGYQTTATVTTVQSDINPANNYDYSYSPIVFSYDPNDKKVWPEGYGPEGAIPQNDSVLTYQIRFQNTGTATAYNLHVLDTIDPSLDLSTLTVTGTSHPYQLDVDSGIVDWIFPNILLPDSNANEPGSHGWIKYKINRKPGLAHGTKIENTAYIYFDFNPAVITNTTRTTICNSYAAQITPPNPKICPGGSITLYSQNSASAYIWSTGDSVGQITVDSAGSYSLFTVDNFGCPSDTHTVTVTLKPTVSSAFSYSGTQQNIAFTDNSTGTIINWKWNFGDGGTSTLQNPTHTYATSGNYQVCLIVTGTCGPDTSCQTVTVSCPVPTSAFSWISNGNQVNFTDQSTNSPTVWNWDFGDGNTSALQNPTHTFATQGAFNVCLTTENDCGMDTVCEPLLLTGAENGLPGGKVTVWPNPAPGHLFVELEMESAEAISLELLSIQGQVLLHENVGRVMHSTLELDLKRFGAGIYFLQVNSPTGTLIRKIEILH